nr:hypothetical protein Q903MT_gene2873 [Picea sitchensis]
MLFALSLFLRAQDRPYAPGGYYTGTEFGSTIGSPLLGSIFLSAPKE